MNADDAERNPFDPPRPRGWVVATVLALLAHALLMLVLTSVLRWNSQSQDLAVQAELWSPTVQRAAPPPPPPPPPPPARPVLPAPPPARPTAVEQRDAEIALAQEKQRRAEQQRRLEEERKLKDLAQQRQAAEDTRRKAQLAQAEQQRRLEQQRKDKELAEKKAAEDAKRKEQQAQAEAAKKAEVTRRMEALRRMKNLADDSPGADERTAGPSGDYAARIRKLVYDNIYFPPDLPGNPVVVVEINTGPTGEIISRRVIKPSGVKAWDDAALRAFDRLQKLPSDKGRYWNPMTVKVTRSE